MPANRGLGISKYTNCRPIWHRRCNMANVDDSCAAAGIAASHDAESHRRDGRILQTARQHRTGGLLLIHSVPGSYAKAETCALEALKLREELQGPHHLEVASLLKDIADIYTAQSRPEDAQQYEERARAALTALQNNGNGAETPPPAEAQVAAESENS